MNEIASINCPKNGPSSLTICFFVCCLKKKNCFLIFAEKVPFCFNDSLNVTIFFNNSCILIAERCDPNNTINIVSTKVAHKMLVKLTTELRLDESESVGRSVVKIT